MDDLRSRREFVGQWVVGIAVLVEDDASWNSTCQSFRHTCSGAGVASAPASGRSEVERNEALTNVAIWPFGRRFSRRSHNLGPQCA